MFDSVRAHRWQTTRLSIHAIFQARVLEWGAIAFSHCIMSIVKFSFFQIQSTSFCYYCCFCLFIFNWSISPWDSPAKNIGVGCHFLLQCMKVKSESEVTQSCPTLSDPMDFSPPGSAIHGIFQARVLEWGAIAFSHCIMSIVKFSFFQMKKYIFLLVLLLFLFIYLWSRYNCFKMLLVSAVQHCESAISIHISPSSWAPLPTPIIPSI